MFILYCIVFIACIFALNRMIGMDTVHKDIEKWIESTMKKDMFPANKDSTG